MNNALGIFFGAKTIFLVETSNRKVVNNIQINRASVLSVGLDEKVPEDIKLVALFKDEIRKNNIIAKEANLALSGNDLIVRTFEMPLLGSQELSRAINFEVKKYIPFKVEDLVSDSQVKSDKMNRRNLVLFVGIKKDVLERYLSVLKQLDITLTSIEYSPFSVLRFAKLAGVGSLGTNAIVSAGLEDEEANFMILDSGFPLFSRDIVLGDSVKPQAQDPEAARTAFLEKLKTELRVSFDFYRRKFPNKKVRKTLFLINPQYRQELEPFIKEIGLAAQFVDIAKYVGKPVPFSLGFIRSYSSSLAKAVKTSIQIDILAVKKSMEKPAETGFAKEVAAMVTQARIDPRSLVIALLIIGGAYGYSYYQQIPIKKELRQSISNRPPVSSIDPELSCEDLEQANLRYKDKLATLDKMIKKQPYFTNFLNILPQIMPEGVWVTDFDYHPEQQGAALELKCITFAIDSQKGMKLANDFFLSLKENPDAGKFFKAFTIVSMKQSEAKGLTVTRFVLSCGNGK